MQSNSPKERAITPIYLGELERRWKAVFALPPFGSDSQSCNKERSMKLDFRNNRDFWAGAMFIAGGAAAMIAARSYPFGTALRMGPGYFPSLLGGILVAFGIYVMVRGLLNGEKIKGSWSVRALIFLPLSMVLFGILMQYAGFIPALAVLVFGSAASGKEFRFGEVFIVAVALIFLSVAVFIWGLGLPYPLFKWF